jgi:hypothetical protein
MASTSTYRPGDGQQHESSHDALVASGAGPVSMVAVASSFESTSPLRSANGADCLEWKATCSIKKSSDRDRSEFVHVGGIVRPTALVRNFRPLMPGPP